MGIAPNPSTLRSPSSSLAVLVENFVIISERAADEARQERIREAKAGRLIKYTLDPLLRYLTMHYTDDADLSDRLQRLFKVMNGHGWSWWWWWVDGGLGCTLM